MKSVKFREISLEIRRIPRLCRGSKSAGKTKIPRFGAKFRGSKTAGKTKIPRFGAKFRGPRKLWALDIRHFHSSHNRYWSRFFYSKCLRLSNRNASISVGFEPLEHKTLPNMPMSILIVEHHSSSTKFERPEDMLQSTYYKHSEENETFAQA